MQKGFTPILLIILIALVTLGGYFTYQTINKSSPPPNEIACTQDAKLCPDGSYVSRSGPNCEFSLCPTPKESTNSADISNWKTFILDNITFKYPPDWQDPEFIITQTKQSAEIKNLNHSQRIVILSGINKGYSEQELSEFINSSTEGGGEKLILDGSEAAKGRVTHQGSKITTVFVTAKDKLTQYSISLQVSESYSDQEIDKLFNQILSTFKFLP